MTSTRIQVKSIVLDRLGVLFDPKHNPTTADGNPNPRYLAYVEMYLEALIPFDAWELEAGTKSALESHKYKHWPQPADMRNYCLQASKDGKANVPTEKPVYLQPGDEQRPDIPQEVRERIGYQFQVFHEAAARHTQGTKFALTLEDCKAEAARRQESE